jgi:hypothetical protein
MRRTCALLCCLASLWLPARTQETARAPEATKIDEFGDIRCGDELARLDNVAHSLREDPRLVAYIVVYGRRREATGRTYRMATYLIKRRGFGRQRVVGVWGGAGAGFRGEFWLAPRGARPPVAESVLRAGKVEWPKSWSRMFDCEDSYADPGTGRTKPPRRRGGR